MKDYMAWCKNALGFEYKDTRYLKSISLVCGYCGEHVAPSKGYCISTRDRDIAYIYQCPHCQNPIIYFIANNETNPGAMFGREVNNLPENIHSL